MGDVDEMYESIVKYVTYPLICRYDGLEGVYRYLRELEKQQYLSPERLRELQWAKFKHMLQYAYDHTAYYRETFDAYGIRPGDVQDFSDLVKVPLLTKEDMTRNRERMISDEYSSSALVPSYSGGTSGEMVRFFYARDCLAYKKAATIRSEKWTGWDIGKKTVLVWPARQDYDNNWSIKMRIKESLSSRSVMCAAANLDEETIRGHLRTIARVKPALIRGFPSPLILLADYVIQNNMNMPLHCNIISTGEPLFRHQREKIERAFGGEVFDSYGSREVSLVGQECELHKGYHINMECNLVEFVRDGRHALVGEVSDMIITDLVNRGMPLIRYSIDDQGVSCERTCECGRGLALFDSIAGRENDVLKSTRGGNVLPSALIMFMIEEGPDIGKMQIIQDRPDHIRILMSGPPEPGESHFAFYRNVITEVFGQDMKFDFEVMVDIPNERSGKFRFAKYEVAGRQLEVHGPLETQ